MDDNFRVLLLQVRNDDDPMRGHEVECFARSLQCRPDQIATHDLIAGPPGSELLDRCDMVVLGGSGDYSVAEGGEWMPRALEGIRRLVDCNKPTFASCWGFQAFAKALGGEVVTDLARAELGTIEVSATTAAKDDPVFAASGSKFLVQAGHQDIVDRLPKNAVLLASTDRVTNQAFRLADRPIYCTQFHPELRGDDLLRRVGAYPAYIKTISGLPLGEFSQSVQDSPMSEALLKRFLETFFPR